jgi:hypothetical protein
MTGNKLIDSEDGKVKYKIKGKNNSFQKRSWDEINKFINHKNDKKLKK